MPTSTPPGARSLRTSTAEKRRQTAVSAPTTTPPSKTTPKTAGKTPAKSPRKNPATPNSKRGKAGTGGAGGGGDDDDDDDDDGEPRQNGNDSNANKGNGGNDGGNDGSKKGSTGTGTEDRLAMMEARMEELERNGEWMKGEIKGLRDQLEEVQWANRNLEGKVGTLKEEAEALKELVVREKEEKKELCDRLKGIETQKVTAENGGGERWKEAVNEKIKEVEERFEKTVKEV